MLSEAAALAILERHLKSTYVESTRGRIHRGIGDDAAVLALGPRQVWTTDACSEGTHFLKDWLSPEDLAHKALQAALSDVPAMGARPVAVLCHLTLPRWVSSRWLERFAAEQARVVRDCRAALVGGNVSFGSGLQVVTSVLGELLHAPLLQSTARLGDQLWVIGELGLARAGLLLLQRGVRRSRSRAVMTCLEAFRRPRAQCAAGVRLAPVASACLDVSDGLVVDLHRLAHQSQVRAVLSEPLVQKLIRPELRQLESRLGETALQLVLRGGEDYALLASGPPEARPRGARPVGWVEAGSGLFWDSGAPLKNG